MPPAMWWRAHPASGQSESPGTWSRTAAAFDRTNGERSVPFVRVERQGKTTAFPRSEACDAAGNVVARASGIWAVRAPP
jgi:hypothetical protein